MDRRYQGQRRKNFPSSSSFNSSTGFRSNQTKSTKVSNFSINTPKNENNSINIHGGRNTKQEDEVQAEAIVGTCPFMCPEDERVQRQRLRDLAFFERLNGDPSKSSPVLAVKKFCRTMSAKQVQASEVRPLLVLEDTLNYLLNFLDSKEHPFEVIHDFVFDRTRSIRQDLTMQNIVNDRVVHMYEKMVQFHVISHHKLRSSCTSSSISSVHYLNLEQFTKALTSLYNLYEVNRGSNSTFGNEAEFYSFYVLLHLDSDGQATGESLSLWFRRVPSSIIKSREMCFARRVLRYFRMGNYRRFLCAAAKASYLQYCIIEPYIDQVRAFALCCINNCGYKLHPYPVMHLSKLLMMEESDVELFCNACGLETCTDEVGNKLLPTKQTTFNRPKEGFQRYSFLGLEQLERQIASFNI
ncbi:SAC3 family protein C isoform X2 [Pistacia vera]|uniref:SAC3 family protein C isoform X2 n=1 Tax=Pistacia vera TaxID=55513 RepID=UPI001262FEB5|nr:SAC3 family protein C isoform X2 [Pistacia vera]